MEKTKSGGWRISAFQETRHQNVVIGDSRPKSRFGRQFRHTETSPYVRNAAISWHFERDPIPYALETDWPVGHVRLELRNVDANYRFERSHRFAGIQPNSGFGDYSRLSCGVGDTRAV